MRRMIDPPEGWKYGFPKELPKGAIVMNTKEWLIGQGYPRELIERYGDHFACSYWIEEDKA